MIKALLKVFFVASFLWAAISLKNGFNDFNGRPGADITTTKISYAQAYYSTEQTMWGWHVVPVIEVEMPDGHSEILVFDPSLFNRPVTVQEFEKGVTVPYKGSNWGYNIPGYEFKPEITRLFYGFRYQYFNFEPLKSSWEVTDLENTVQTMRTYKSYQPKYPPLEELKKQKGEQVANKESDEKLREKINALGGSYPAAGAISTDGILWPTTRFGFGWSDGVPLNGQSTSISDAHFCSSAFLEAM